MRLTRTLAYSLALATHVLTSTSSHAAEVQIIKHKDGSRGLAIRDAGLASMELAKPLQIEVWDASRNERTTLGGSYEKVEKDNLTWRGSGNLRLNAASFAFTDTWTFTNNVLRLARSVRVSGNAAGGFMSAAVFNLSKGTQWTNIQWFAPGMIYGGSDHLSPQAIGGKASYRPGNTVLRIREDRLPAPLFAARFPDARTVTLLNGRPNGSTTLADGEATTPGVLIDDRFRFGAIGAEETSGGIKMGFWFPGSEGSQTYAGNTYPGGQIEGWRRRFHPVRDGLEQHYEVALRFDKATGLPELYRDSWRWAWDVLRPRKTAHDIAIARKALVDVLAMRVIETNGWAGIPNYLDAVTKDPKRADPKAIMGFTGKNLEAANFMLQESALRSGQESEELRRKAELIIASFLKLGMSPPVGEGFNLRTGIPALALGGKKQVYLRSFGDDLKALMKAWVREKQAGRDHPEWLAWCRSFGDWLLTQQQPNGGFPRSWAPGTGEVASPSPNSSYNAVPLLTLLSQATGDKRYLRAAIRAADFCWHHGQSRGLCVGGTIDNPDVLDKEAATLSLEAYLQLHKATGETKWLERAKAAADFAETWVYIWNVPMPMDADPQQLGWKPGVSTVGAQLIATGHSLVDCYMTYDADDYARLAKLTRDPHYRLVAEILLHNTKGMLALPGRTYDLVEPGWQQEHWSFAPRRGNGLHRGWLPWVATSHLNGIFGVIEEDPALLSP